MSRKLRLISFMLCLIFILGNIRRELFYEELKKIDFESVKADIISMFTNSKEFWPADYGNYAPFFIRLAWHCAGSYRNSDGRGGCDGARIRFDPERSWDDNTNLDKARKLLVPIKEKYGLGLSWGDLIALTGTTAIESMNGPVLGFCPGRMDDDDGLDSLLLGPTPEQDALHPCLVNGQCKAPLGPTTLGLIYVNPEGPMAQPIPEGSVHDIREVFSRMSMNDTETVALIGGGHAFGKTHGACPSGPGKKPNEDEVQPWQGKCGGTGKGINTFTSGFEGPWTTNPLQWDNEYFNNLLNYKFEVHKGPGDHNQWRVAKNNNIRSSNYEQNYHTYKRPTAENVNGRGRQEIMMLTTDIALTRDSKYLEIVKEYAKDLNVFSNDFAHAWYKLVTRDMGPITRCFGADVPAAQDFQYPLPPPPLHEPDWSSVKQEIIKVMYSQSEYLTPDFVHGKPYYGSWFVKLAWQCASTFRRTDYLGGCNGARIRFSPQKDWKRNIGMDSVLDVLQAVKDKFNPSLTWADLIVLAGTTALEEATKMEYSFCGGRSDATDGSGSEFLNLNKYPNLLAAFKDLSNLRGLTSREAVALQARIRGAESQKKIGFHGTWMGNDMNHLGNDYFKILLEESWTPVDKREAKSDVRENTYMSASDFVVLYNAPLLAIVQEFASDNRLFLEVFRGAWTKLMNSDRFDGPVHNLCDRSREGKPKLQVEEERLIKKELFN